MAIVRQESSFKFDVPAYGIGSLGGNFYGPNEWVDVDDLVRLVAVLIQTHAGWAQL